MTLSYAQWHRQVRAERLRHPSGVSGLQWSPSGLQQGAPQYEHLQVRELYGLAGRIQQLVRSY